ncbi:MAG: OmpA family protein [Gammaproteobacteria bacterium]
MYFTTDKASIRTQSHRLLDELAIVATSCSSSHIEIEGYTDSRGQDSYNQKLSQRRAGAVLKYLVDAGVPTDRMLAIGYGEEKPVANNETEAGRARNRQIEFKVKQHNQGL